MVLSDIHIEEAIKHKKIVIKPFTKKNLQPASYDVHLSQLLIKPTMHDFNAIDPTKLKKGDLWVQNKTTPYTLRPGEFILGALEEYVEIGDTLVGKIEGKSSLARLGLIIHTTAGYIDPGFKGYLTLELVNLGGLDLILTEGMEIAQLSFQTLTSKVSRPYGHPELKSKHANQIARLPYL